MDSVIGRLFFVALFSTAFAGGSYVFFSSILASASTDALRAVTVLDSYKDGAHTLTGIVMVPSPCHTLSAKTQDIDAHTIALVFETWQEPYKTCASELTPRHFSTTVFAPQSVVFKGLLDGSFVQTTVLASN